jgi:hypothetical protein
MGSLRGGLQHGARLKPCRLTSDPHMRALYMRVAIAGNDQPAKVEITGLNPASFANERNNAYRLHMSAVELPLWHPYMFMPMTIR